MLKTDHPLRTIRKERGLSQTALAERSGCHWTVVQKAELDAARVVRLSDLRAIAAALDVSWREIHAAGQPLLADTEEDLAEILDGREARCACAAGLDPTSVIAGWLGRDPSDPAFRDYVTELRTMLAAETAA